MRNRILIICLIVILINMLIVQNVYAISTMPATLDEFVEMYANGLSENQINAKAAEYEAAVDRTFNPSIPRGNVEQAETLVNDNSESYESKKEMLRANYVRDALDYWDAPGQDRDLLIWYAYKYAALFRRIVAAEELDGNVGGNTSGGNTSTGNTSGGNSSGGNTSGGQNISNEAALFDNAYREYLDVMSEDTVDEARLETAKTSMQIHFEELTDAELDQNVTGIQEQITRLDAYTKAHSTFVNQNANPDLSTGIDGIEERNKTIDEIVSDAQKFVKPQNLSGTYDQDEFDAGISKIYNILFAIGMVIAVVWGITLGIKFLYASAEGQAEIKKQLLPYITGVFIIFGAFGIWKIVLEIMKIMS